MPPLIKNSFYGFEGEEEMFYIWHMQKLKHIVALFSVLVFLFPLVETELHNFSHFNDVHCMAVNGHYHQGEHHCLLCDATNDLSATPSFHHPDLVAHELCDLTFFFLEKSYFVQQKDFLSLRAPPSLI